MMTNREILDTYLPLMDTCIDCQWAYFREDRQNKDDFRQDLALIILEYDNDKLNDVVDNCHMNAFLSRIIIQNIGSKTSPYYKAYKKFNDRISGEITEEMEETIADEGE